MNNETGFTIRFSEEVQQQGELYPDDAALRELADCVGATLPSDVMLRIRTSRYDLHGHRPKTDGKPLNADRKPLGAGVYAFSLRDMAAQTLEVIEPAVTTEHLTAQLARELHNNRVLNEGARRREFLMRQREAIIVGATVAALAIEGIATDFRNGLLAGVVMGVGFMAGFINRRQYAFRKSQFPLLPANTAPPVRVVRHSPEL